MSSQEHIIRREIFPNEEEEDEKITNPPDNDEEANLKEQLAKFRQQWQAELMVRGRLDKASGNSEQSSGSPSPRPKTPISGIRGNTPPSSGARTPVERSVQPRRLSTDAPTPRNLPSFMVTNSVPSTAGDAKGLKAATEINQHQLLSSTVIEKKVVGKSDNNGNDSNDEQSIENKAKELFIQGVNAERHGNLTEAICKYRHAIQLVPDVESKITDYTAAQEDVGDSDIQEGYEDDYEDDTRDDSLGNLELELQALTTSDINSHCEPELTQNSTHISALPVELLLYIFRWVISSDLDLRSLELLSLVCRGFYVCARDPAIWHQACLSIFGRGCCKTKEYTTWRQMYVERPRPNFNGLYISKYTYFRKGEPSMDGMYRPWHMVEYYRYVRLFPDGTILMYSAPDEPKAVVSKLRNQTTTLQSVLVGNYRLVGDMITGILRRENTKVYDNHQRRYIRYKRHMNLRPDTEHNFYVEFVIHSTSHRPNFKLEWHAYSCQTLHRPTGNTSITEFEVDKKFKPLIFSRVKSYTNASEKPL